MKLWRIETETGARLKIRAHDWKHAEWLAAVRHKSSVVSICLIEPAEQMDRQRRQCAAIARNR